MRRPISYDDKNIQADCIKAVTKLLSFEQEDGSLIFIRYNERQVETRINKNQEKTVQRGFYSEQ